MYDNAPIISGKNWKYVSRYFMCARSFTPLSQFFGDKVGSSVLGTFGFVCTELPNPDVELQTRIIKLPIENKSDYKSIYKAYNDKGVKDGINEVVLIYEERRNLFGRPKACFHVAIYRTGTWSEFFEAVKNYSAHEFIWPRPLILFQPSSTNIFPTSRNIFSI